MSAVFLALVTIFASQTLAQRQHAAAAQVAVVNPLPTDVPCPTATGLPIVPEIQRSNGRLKATLKVTSGLRTIWDSATPPGTSAANTRCGTAFLRYFTGHRGLNPNAPDDPRFAAGDLLPGPTLRARVGDWVEIAMLNQINLKNFGKSLDRGDYEPASGGHHVNPSTATPNPSSGCDVTTQSQGGKSSSANGDTFPNCIHGSSTTNVHFHGTHTSPSTTGDNVLLFVRPALQFNGSFLQPYMKNINDSFAEFFARCETTGAPTKWEQMPTSWRKGQRAAIKYYDEHTPYRGGPQTLPKEAQLWPVNNREINHGLWPQYSIGASPYCFHLPAYDAAKNNPPFQRTMGQAPGTHWYHAHKHGSTALNVANGMVGALIIEGAYDDQLRTFYRSHKAWDYQEKVLVIQQLTGALRKTDPTAPGPPTAANPQMPGVPVLSINGRRSPVMTMRPNQVQLLRFINGAERDGALFQMFVPEASKSSPGPQQPCSLPSTAPCVHWNQTAQDGVQFNTANYDPGNTTGKGYQGAAKDAQFYLAPANRADLLVQAPSTPGRYDLIVAAGVCRIPNNSPPCGWGQQEVLLTVSVEGTAVTEPMPFIPVENFPTFPVFLNDIKASDVVVRRELVFHDSKGLRINGQQFADTIINQSMLLNAVEEWKISNLDNDKEHPFHIHINPFQIIEVFQPQSKAAKLGGSCYADPLKPATWRQCDRPQSNFEWWDTFAIPVSRIDDVTSTCTTAAQCPEAIRNIVSCASGKCSVTIPGFFRMRSQFVDFTGQYVLHCHILTHEDRGMMQLIEVVPDRTLYTHH